MMTSIEQARLASVVAYAVTSQYVFRFKRTYTRRR